MDSAADVILGGRVAVKSVKSILNDAPLPWLFVINRAPLLLANVCGMVCLMGAGWNTVQRGYWDDTPLRAAVVVAVFGLLFGTLATLMGMCLFIRRISPRAVESIQLVMLIACTVFCWLGSLQYENTEKRKTTTDILTTLFYTFPSVLCMRLWPTIIWSSWLFIGSCTTYYFASEWPDDGSFQRYVIRSCICNLLFFVFARTSQFRLWALHKAQTRQMAENGIREKILSLLTDGMIWLADDGDTIANSDQRFQASMSIPKSEHFKVSNHILRDAAEAARFHEAVERARQEPVLITAAVANNRNCKVIIVNAENTHMDWDSSFLVCLSFTDSESCEVEFDDRQCPSNLWHDHLDDCLATPCENSVIHDTSSVPESTTTGRVFEHARVACKSNNEDEAKHCIDSVISIGQREHWLLPESAVKIRRDRVLGSGGFGTVLEAEYHGLGTAVKVPHGQRDGVQKIASIMNELRLVRLVCHPNVVLFLGAYINASNLDVGLVFERVDGLPLHKCIGSLPNALTRRLVVKQIGCAMRYLHAQTPAIVHGDVKLSNVLMEIESNVYRAKLADFGLSRVISKNSTVLGGTLYWLAPEMIRAGPSARPSQSADVFAFGRLIFCIVFGTCKCCVDTSRNTIIDMAHLNIVVPMRTPPLETSLARKTYEICNSCTHPKVEERPTMEQVHETVLKWNTDDDKVSL
eukprot:TRINITY_DN13811_c0_g1_i2.p1 TRINITY_DN13811_c0_g1~~TRINITY_DN13811_c0_g1_i2.p1  ORF type:complete len:719 (-),score=74.82 TRINITY_DN13811_c0_g1_i2:243-2318(-)